MEISGVVLGSGFVSLDIVDLALDIQRLSRSVVITCHDELILRGVRVDAINYPDRNLIKFDCKNWNNLSSSQRHILVLHEFSYMTGRDDSDYEYSNTLFSIYQMYRITSEFSSLRLRNTIISCNVKEFNELVHYADVNYVYEHQGRSIFKNPTSLQIAFEVGCAPIVHELMRWGAIYSEIGVDLDFLNYYVRALRAAVKTSLHEAVVGTMTARQYLIALTYYAEDHKITSAQLSYDTCSFIDGVGFPRPNPAPWAGCGKVDIGEIMEKIKVPLLEASTDSSIVTLRIDGALSPEVRQRLGI